VIVGGSDVDGSWAMRVAAQQTTLLQDGEVVGDR